MVAIIGLGNMGRAMAERLVETGDAPVVWNRTAARAEGLEGVTVAESPAKAVAASDVVLSILANDAATEAIYFGEEGILSTDLKGKVIVEMCTMAPERAKALGKAVTDAGGLFLECPVGGTVAPARQGQLLGLAGGSDEAFAKAKPVLEKLCRRLEHLGPVGAGAAMKLSINLPLMVYWSALGEAIAIALGNGIPADKALDILVDSSGAIGAAKRRVPPIMAMITSGDAGGVNFSVANAIKDMELMVAAAEALDAPSGSIRSALERAKAGVADGYGDIDVSMVAALAVKGSG